MAFLEQRPPASRATALFGAAGIQALIGTVLFLGLATTVTEPDEKFPFYGEQIKPNPLPPPEPIEKSKPDPALPEASTSDQYFPKPPISIPLPAPGMDSSDVMNMGSDPAHLAGDSIIASDNGTDIGKIVIDPPPSPVPTFDPIPARPRNNPAQWVTKRDYRPVWANRDMVGIAGFRLSIDAHGNVRDCQITRSSGYSALDKATCRLIRKRAKFNAARNSSGDSVAGSYSNSVSWELND